MTRHLPIIVATGVSLLALGAWPARAADPTTAECLSANEASLTARSQHRLRDARAKLLTCAARTCPADVRDECTRSINEINAALPTIVFDARDAAGVDLVAVKVKMDGELLAEHLDGSALAVDPGQHSFSFETPGQPKTEKALLIREGEKNRRERIVFESLTAAPGRSVGGRSAAPGTTLTSSPSGTAGEAASPGLGAQRIGALVAAGVGIIGVGVGIGYGLDSKSKHDRATQACPGAQCPDKTGADLWDQAIFAGTVSTAAFIVGTVGLATGAVLWFTGKPERSNGALQVGVGAATLQVRGNW